MEVEMILSKSIPPPAACSTDLYNVQSSAHTGSLHSRRLREYEIFQIDTELGNSTRKLMIQVGKLVVGKIWLKFCVVNFVLQGLVGKLWWGKWKYHIWDKKKSSIHWVFKTLCLCLFRSKTVPSKPWLRHQTCTNSRKLNVGFICHWPDVYLKVLDVKWPSSTVPPSSLRDHPGIDPNQPRRPVFPYFFSLGSSFLDIQIDWWSWTWRI